MSTAGDLYNQFRLNPLMFGMWYFPHHFSSVGSPFHLKVLDLAVDRNIKRLAVAAPRESAKSTILSFLTAIHAICFKYNRHILNVQSTFNKSANNLETIKDEIKANERLRQDFGIEFKKDREGDSIFNHSDGFSTRFLCRGADQIGGVRGEKYGAYRPDLILIDDLEDDELVRNPERRKELIRNFDEALIPAGDREKLRVIAMGTILHDDSLMAKLVSKDLYPEWRKLKFRARIEREGKYYSLWPEKWSVEALNALERDKPGVFAKEYQNDPTSGLTATFKREDFRYWKIQDNDYILFHDDGSVKAKGRLSDCRAAIACDLAFDEKRSSDFSVVMPGFLTPQADILLDDYFCKKGVKPDEFEHIIFPMEERLRLITGSSVPVGFEKAKLEKVARHLLGKAMRNRNHFITIKDLMWDTDKITRMITRLEPRYSQHVIYHKRGMGDYEEQLLRVPNGTHDDLPDAAQGLVQLLQFPKSVKVEAAKESTFNWWRKQTSRFKEQNKSMYHFGRKNDRSLIRTTVSPPA